ncbi:GNAT family N-acetyltransferase [Pseudalkalibacillus berkeleyi]|uniref:GNAT family N-acetyltransferase n=1 Tax=Pseudalkalibacillus berkeleyi TaxID=1069813 RepID=A0ABS9GVN9_9BACL|nr:GNAT family N-acetyltransferase [Pseudalkalibacillus berkeleyi]MCF6136764.1 GNAT family N-acetyltransferase [Pseudalkalibacillus berkeleyi]
MIRKLTDKDHEQVMDFLSVEPALNLFIIGDIENFGYETDFQQLWGEWQNDRLIAVLLRYKENFIPYAKGDFDVKGFAEIVLAAEQFQILSGKEEIIDQFDPYIPSKQKRSMYFAEITNRSNLEKIQTREEIHVATVDDVEAIFTLRENIEEFTASSASRDSMVHTIQTNSGRTYFMKDQGKAITSASTTAENSKPAMIVGVCTATNYRNKGLASKCLSALCDDVLKEGKSLCLFYDNPAAGSIYQRLGFNEVGRWTLLHKAE